MEARKGFQTPHISFISHISFLRDFLSIDEQKRDTVGERIHSLDTVKGIALTGVFFLHARWMYKGSGVLLEDIIEFNLFTISRLAVPIFFLTSGYLLYMKLDKLDKTEGRKYTRDFLSKIGKTYLAATAIYYVLNVVLAGLNSYLNLEPITNWIVIKTAPEEVIWNLLYTGQLGAGHIWFMTALFYSILSIYLAYRYGHFLKLLIASAGFHLVGILSRTYNLAELPIPRDDALFFGLFFTAAGFYINRENLWSEKSRKYLFHTALLANIVHILERIFISRQLGYEPFFWNNYSLMTSVAAITLFLYFLNRKDFGKESVFNRYGKNTLWIYLVHAGTLGVFVGAANMLGSFLGFEPMNSLVLSVMMTLTAYFLTSELVLRFSDGRSERRKDG